MMNDSVAPVTKTLSRLIGKDELTDVSGGGTIVKLSQESSTTTEDSFSPKGTYEGTDTITNN